MRWDEPQTKQHFGPWLWLCCPCCNIMFIPWFSSNLSHILISLRNCIFFGCPADYENRCLNITRRDIWPLETTFGHLRENTVYASISFSVWDICQNRNQEVVCLNVYFLTCWSNWWPCSCLVSLPCLPQQTCFGVFCLFVKFRFLKFQPHMYAFNMKSITMAVRIHESIEWMFFLLFI